MIYDKITDTKLVYILRNMSIEDINENETKYKVLIKTENSENSNQGLFQSVMF